MVDDVDWEKVPNSSPERHMTVLQIEPSTSKSGGSDERNIFSTKYLFHNFRVVTCCKILPFWATGFISPPNECVLRICIVLYIYISISRPRLRVKTRPRRWILKGDKSPQHTLLRMVSKAGGPMS
jgi:hypothetical protein